MAHVTTNSAFDRREHALWPRVLLFLVIVIFLAAGCGVVNVFYPWFSHEWDQANEQADRILNDTYPQMWSRFTWGAVIGTLVGVYSGARVFREPRDDDFRIPRDDTL